MVRGKVLVTGGNGYIGARLCLFFANAGYSVTALCYSRVPTDALWLAKMDRVVVGDVRDEQLLSRLAAEKYDVLVHLVSLDHHQSKGSPAFVSAVNISPVWSLLDIFSKQRLSKFVYLSTAQVYGYAISGLISEAHPLKAANAYAMTHQLGEVICDYFNRNSEVSCRAIRLSNSYGAPVFDDNNCWWLVINDLCRKAFQEKEIRLSSDGSPLRDFIHGSDVCRGILAIIETDQAHPVYNLCSGTTHSIMEIAKMVRDVFAERYAMQIPISTAVPESTNRPEHFTYCNTLLSSIGFKPEISLEKGIKELLDYVEGREF